MLFKQIEPFDGNRMVASLPYDFSPFVDTAFLLATRVGVEQGLTPFVRDDRLGDIHYRSLFQENTVLVEFETPFFDCVPDLNVSEMFNHLGYEVWTRCLLEREGLFRVYFFIEEPVSAD